MFEQAQEVIVVIWVAFFVIILVGLIVGLDSRDVYVASSQLRVLLLRIQKCLQKARGK